MANWIEKQWDKVEKTVNNTGREIGKGINNVGRETGKGINNTGRVIGQGAEDWVNRIADDPTRIFTYGAWGVSDWMDVGRQVMGVTAMEEQLAEQRRQAEKENRLAEINAVMNRDNAAMRGEKANIFLGTGNKNGILNANRFNNLGVPTGVSTDPETGVQI